MTSVAWRVGLGGVLLLASMGVPGAAQESGGEIVLDIPVQSAGSPADSQEQVTIAVRGMKKSRSGAT